MPQDPVEYGRDLADEWEDAQNTISDPTHDLADAVRNGDLTEEELDAMADAFVERVRQLMASIVREARQELEEERQDPPRPERRTKKPDPNRTLGEVFGFGPKPGGPVST